MANSSGIKRTECQLCEDMAEQLSKKKNEKVRLADGNDGTERLRRQSEVE